MLNIKQIKDFSPEDVPSVTFEGKVGYVGEAKRKTGTTQAGKEYDFWSQFITVEDDTEKVGVSTSTKIAEKDKLITEADKNRRVKITNGKLRDYQDKSGKTQREIRAGKVEFLDVRKEAPVGERKSAGKQERGLDTGRQIAAQAVAKSLIEAGLKEPTKQTIDWATTWCVWIEAIGNGKYNIPKESQKQEEINDDPEIPENETGNRSDEIARIHILANKLEKEGYWTVEDGYKLWLKDEFDKNSSKDLTPEERVKAIEILAKWMNERLEGKENG